MKTENPKMAINYLFDVGFDSFAYIADFRGVGTGQSFTKKFGGKFREINGEPSLLRSMCDMGSRPHFFP